MNVDLIDLKIDYAFKLIFGREGQEPVLVAFLNAVLKPMEGKQILSLKYTNSELNKEYVEDKKASLDIRAETEDGRHINVEIVKRHVAIQNCLWGKSYSKVKTAGIIN
jgi:predicted transposase/invertase (TIGR01784 family)